MPKRKGKDVGKVVKVRRKRVGFRLPGGKVVAVVAVLALVSLITLYAYTSLSTGGRGAVEEVGPREVLELLTSGGNTSVVLVYEVSGDLPLGNDTVLNVYDRVTFVVYSYVVALDETYGTGNASRGYIINYYGVNPAYLTYYLLLKLGIPSVAEDLRNLFTDTSILNLTYTDISSAYLGKEILNSMVLGTVEVEVYEVRYDSTTVRKYCDTVYSIPVEVKAVLNGTYSIRLILNNVNIVRI